MSPGELAAAVFAAALLAGLAFVGWALRDTRRELQDLRARAAQSEPVGQMLERQIEAVRTESRANQEGLRIELGALSDRVKDELTEVRLAVGTELKGVTAEVSRQLDAGMRLIQTGQDSMGERLDRASRVVGEVQGSLGKLGEATLRIAEVGRDIQGLEQILRSPKVRGGLGETLLEQLLDQMLPREHWSLQHGFRGGDRVDAVIKVGGRLVPVDAKFPLENFRRLLAETEDERRRAARRAFARDVRLRVDEIARKYILPDEGTFDFALMYVPAENVYYEVIVKEDEAEDAIAAHALARKVVPVSPNTLYTYLQVIVLGLRGLRIEAHAKEIQADLIRLAGDLERVREHWNKVGGHLGNAQKQFTDAERDLSRLEDKLAAIERKGGQAELPGMES
ncbi:MAG: DNA recombination protein RmuC [Candidatus Rokubacteria bacterium]|nr:DNA recombination protein RmuC [Candidatus Rokubacteria bacterium]